MYYPRTTPSVAEETVSRIVELIRSGGYAPGYKLPGERQLSKQLQVGRTSVREAISRLETLGLLEVRHGLGTFVKDPGNQILQTALTPHILTDQDKLEELFELREIVETAAAARAAQRATTDQIETMRQWVQTIETAVARQDAISIVTADVEFHRQIIIATGNTTLVDFMDSIVHLLRDMRHDSTHIPELVPQIVSDHRTILAAIESGNSQTAARAMQEHLANVAARVKNFWQQKVED